MRSLGFSWAISLARGRIDLSNLLAYYYYSSVPCYLSDGFSSVAEEKKAWHSIVSTVLKQPEKLHRSNDKEQEKHQNERHIGCYVVPPDRSRPEDAVVQVKKRGGEKGNE